jgi:hypothetical protein
MEDKKKSNKILIGIAIGMIIIFAIKQIFFKPSFDAEMVNMADQINKSCPMMIDHDTRLENTAALPKNTFQYNYTLVNYMKDSINIDELKRTLEPLIIKGIKNSPDLQVFRINKTTLSYNYKDKKGAFVAKLDITPDKYKD